MQKDCLLCKCFVYCYGIADLVAKVVITNKNSSASVMKNSKVQIVI